MTLPIRGYPTESSFPGEHVVIVELHSSSSILVGTFSAHCGALVKLFPKTTIATRRTSTSVLHKNYMTTQFELSSEETRKT